MKREAIVARNLQQSAARHRPSVRGRLRRLGLYAASAIPLAPTSSGDRQRILLLRPDHLGDALLTLPAINALRASFPDAQVRALASPVAATVLGSLPALDGVEAMDFPGFSRSGRGGEASPWRLALQTARALRQQGFTEALVLRPDHWWGALVAWLAGIPRRTGYATPDTRPFLTKALPLQQEHAVLRNLRLASELTGLEPDPCVPLRFPVAAADRARARAILQVTGLADDERFVCIHPGTGARLKHWAAGRWAQVAEGLRKTMGVRVVFTGSAEERSLVQEIMGQLTAPALNLAGRTDLGELAACLERAGMVLGPDSGPLHLAASVGTPTVTLFGPADPVEFGPWGEAGKHLVLASTIDCRPCRILDWQDDDLAWHPCMLDISVDQVVEAALSIDLHAAR